MNNEKKTHQGLSNDRWHTYSLMFQLANVGTDIERVIYWRKQGNMQYSEQAFYRALELLSMTILDPKNKGSRLKELTRVREALIDYFIYDNIYESNDLFWQQYFYSFNYAAALERAL